MDYESDVRISTGNLNQAFEAYRKIRNTMRFMLANTTDFEPSKHAVALVDLRSAWTNTWWSFQRYRGRQLKKRMKTTNSQQSTKTDELLYQADYHNLLSRLLVKDAVYIEHEDNYERRAMQTVIYDILCEITKLLASQS